MVKLVDTRDLKSRARKGVPVRFRLRAPGADISTIRLLMAAPPQMELDVLMTSRFSFSGRRSANLTSPILAPVSATSPTGEVEIRPFISIAPPDRARPVLTPSATAACMAFLSSRSTRLSGDGLASPAMSSGVGACGLPVAHPVSTGATSRTVAAVLAR
jgi:hypothetical protein